VTHGPETNPELEAELESQWYLIGNIVEQRPYGEGGTEVRPGTKHFSGGTKVYCLPAQWGDGYEKIVVVGRHRGSKRFETMVLDSSCVTNWRAKVVYSPAVLRRLAHGFKGYWNRKWESKDEIDAYIELLQRRERRE